MSAQDIIDFLDHIEGDGYGGIADFEIARSSAKEIASEIERLRAKLDKIAELVFPPLIDGVWTGDIVDAVKETIEHQRMQLVIAKNALIEIEDLESGNGLVVARNIAHAARLLLTDEKGK